MNWLTRLGLGLDRFLNILLLNGQPDETISHHAAVAEQHGRVWGCWLCWILTRLVQPHHCALQLIPSALPEGVALRAGALLLGVVILIGLAVYWVALTTIVLI